MEERGLIQPDGTKLYLNHDFDMTGIKDMENNKTPEQLAEEWTRVNGYVEPELKFFGEYVTTTAFLAGYQAAQKNLVIAIWDNLDDICDDTYYHENIRNFLTEQTSIKLPPEPTIEETK